MAEHKGANSQDQLNFSSATSSMPCLYSNTYFLGNVRTSRAVDPYILSLSIKKKHPYMYDSQATLLQQLSGRLSLCTASLQSSVPEMAFYWGGIAEQWVSKHPHVQPKLNRTQSSCFGSTRLKQLPCRHEIFPSTELTLEPERPNGHRNVGPDVFDMEGWCSLCHKSTKSKSQRGMCLFPWGSLPQIALHSCAISKL